MSNFKVGISIGDINGVGPEVILKVLGDERILNHITPVIYGSTKVVGYHKNILDGNIKFQGIISAEHASRGRINVIDCWKDNAEISLGQATEQGGKFAFVALEKSVDDLKNGLIDALVTAPINKKAMNMAKFPYAGHTEFLAEASGKKESLMLLVNDGLRVGLVTNHLPLKDVPKAITKERLRDKIKIFDKTLRMDFGIDKPLIAVLGLNPHAGDNGVLGDEEENIIRPVILELKRKGILLMGPYPADGFFGSSQRSKFDGILAMYHDQGLVAFKSLSFGEGVNYTAGLNFIRTSPDHGTAYDLAGKNEANPDSFRKALYLAKDISANRLSYNDDHSNTVERVDIEVEKQPEG